MSKIRTCISCRLKADRSYLLRFVRSLDGEIVFDKKSCLPSRGAWLCPKKSCLIKAFQKQLLFKGKSCLKINSEEMISLCLKEDGCCGFI